MAQEELHIASLVVHSTPRRLQRVGTALAALPGAQVHATSPDGKLVVTIEAPSAEQLTRQVAGIQRIDGVLSAALVFQCSDSLAAMNEAMTDAEA